MSLIKQNMLCFDNEKTKKTRYDYVAKIAIISDLLHLREILLIKFVIFQL